MSKKLVLRPHQKECVAGVEREYRKRSRRTLAVMAAGTGKTIVFLYLANQWARKGARVLILAHLRELIYQPLERADEFFPDLADRMGIVMAQEDDPGSQVVIATVQTMTRSKERMSAVLEHGEFNYVILDEAHHCTAATYMKLTDQFAKARWLGLTATPIRTDRDSLARVFDSVAYRFPISAAIDRGVLVPFDAYGFRLPVSIQDLKETKDGWDAGGLGDLLSAENALEVVYEKWLEYAKGLRTICFTASVRQAHETARYFSLQGVKARAVDGTTPKAVRDDLYERFLDGRVELVANCRVWTEGVDIPEAACALMVCPSKSDLAYVQKLGRVLRLAPGKDTAIILDFAPLEDRDIVMAGEILETPRAVVSETTKAERSGLLVATRVDAHGLAVSVDPAQVLVEALRYLRRGTLAWALQDILAVATLSEKSMLAVELPDVYRLAKAEELRADGDWNKDYENLYQHLRRYKVWICEKLGRSWEANFFGSYPTMDSAIKASESAAGPLAISALSKRRSQWRYRPVSEGQARYLHRLGVPEQPQTSGQASQLIASALASRAILKIRPIVEQDILDYSRNA